MSKSRTKLIINNKDVEREVARCDRIIKSKTTSDDHKAKAYKIKADALQNLRNRSEEINNEIEFCYLKAIELEPYRQAAYLAHLSNFYISCKKIEAALQNITTIEETMEELISIERMYVNKTLLNLKK